MMLFCIVTDENMPVVASGWLATLVFTFCSAWGPASKALGSPVSFARTGSQAEQIGKGFAVGRLVISCMIPGSLHRPLSHSAFVEVTLMPSRLWESNFTAWDRERPPWPSVFADGVKVIKSKVEWAYPFFSG